MGLKHILRDFGEGATVHGVRYIATGTWRFKLFWTAMVFVGLGGLLFTLFNQMIVMLAHTSAIQQEVKIASSMPFPGVTICNLNFFKKSGVSRLPAFYKYLISYDIFLDYSYFDEELEDPDELLRIPLTGPEVEQIQNSTPSIADTFVDCSWLGKQRDCGELFLKRSTDFGRCFTFNTRDNGLNESLVSRRPEEEGGLVVTLNVQQSEYIPSTSGSAGFYVLLHDFHDTPIFVKGFTVSPGFSHTARLEMREATYLPAPYKAYGNTTCQDRSEGKLKYFPEYDQGACYWECKIDYIVDKCACKNVFDPDSVPFRYCSPYELLYCYDVQDYNFWTQNGTVSCQCPPACYERLFDIGLSFSYYPSEAYVPQQGWDASERAEYRKNILELKLFYDNFLYHTFTQVPLYTFDSLSASVGGQMGLYLGISVLSVVELMFILFKCTGAILAKLTAKCGCKKRATGGDVPLESLTEITAGGDVLLGSRAEITTGRDVPLDSRA